MLFPKFDFGLFERDSFILDQCGTGRKIIYNVHETDTEKFAFKATTLSIFFL